MPAQQRLRRDQQAMAAGGRQQAACSGEQGAVARSQLRALDLTTQDLELMTQHKQLDVLGISAPAAADQQLQERHKREVDEGQGIQRSSQEPTRRTIQARSGF